MPYKLLKFQYFLFTVRELSLYKDTKKIAKSLKTNNQNGNNKYWKQNCK